jgi:hypothetical protein
MIQMSPIQRMDHVLIQDPIERGEINDESGVGIRRARDHHFDAEIMRMRVDQRPESMRVFI